MKRLIVIMILLMATETGDGYIAHRPVPLSEYTDVGIEGFGLIVPVQTWRH